MSTYKNMHSLGCSKFTVQSKKCPMTNQEAMFSKQFPYIYIRGICYLLEAFIFFQVNSQMVLLQIYSNPSGNLGNLPSLPSTTSLLVFPIVLLYLYVNLVHYNGGNCSKYLCFQGRDGQFVPLQLFWKAVFIISTMGLKQVKFKHKLINIKQNENATIKKPQTLMNS